MTAIRVDATADLSTLAYLVHDAQNQPFVLEVVDPLTYVPAPAGTVGLLSLN